MKIFCRVVVVFCALMSVSAQAEILAMVNYESKTPESLKSLKLDGTAERQEGIAILDVDPNSANFGQILMTIPLPNDLVAHHIFYDKSMTKAYITSLGKTELRIMDLTQNPYRIETMAVDSCQVGEDVFFSEDNTRWFLTCMGSNNVVVGDVKTDAIIADIKMEKPYPHGVTINSDIDRLLVTSTVHPTDMADTGEYINVIQASTLKQVGSVKVSDKASPSGEAPVEVIFLPDRKPATAYVTNMFGNTLWAMQWQEQSQDFVSKKVFDFNEIGAGVPLEIYFTPDSKRMYVTTASPGKLHVFDLGSDLLAPKLVHTIDTAEGAHHVAFTRDMKWGFVQNALLNLPGMSDGEITVVDLETHKVVARIDTLKDMGLNPNSMVLLPEWNFLAGH